MIIPPVLFVPGGRMPEGGREWLEFIVIGVVTLAIIVGFAFLMVCVFDWLQGGSPLLAIITSKLRYLWSLKIV